MKLISQLRNIVYEAVGVPENISESATKLYKDILQYLESIIDPMNDVGEYSELQFNIENYYRVSDFQISSVELKIKIFDNKKPVLIGMSFNNNPIPSLTHVKITSTSDIKLGIRIGANYEDKSEVIFELFKNERSKFIAALAHELKHAYDFYKKPENSIESFVDYHATLQANIGDIPSLRELIFGMYFSHQIENLVRPSEMYTELSSKNVTKQKFLNEFNKSGIIRELNILRNLTYDKILQNLNENYDKVLNTILRNLPDANTRTKEENIQIYLSGVRKVILKLRADLMSDVIYRDEKDELISALINLPSNAQKKYSEYIRKITQGGKYDETFDYEKSKKINEEFFSKIINNINFVGEKSYKKIAKVYSLLPDENENSQTLNKKINMKVTPTNEQNYVDKDYLFEVSGNTPCDFTDVTIPKTLPKKGKR